MNSTCVRCNRPLKDPESRKRGMGDICAGKSARRAANDDLLGEQPVLQDVGTLKDVGIVCQKLEDGRIACNVPQVVKHHSPTGFGIGFAGSGPADLALNVLHMLLPPKRDLAKFEPGYDDIVIDGVRVSAEAWRLHQDLKFKFIATMPEEGGRVPIEEINEWIAQQLMGSAA